MNMLDHAISYAEAGLKVFPIFPKGKSPLAKLVPNGQWDATDNVAIINDWWRVVPEANIGMPMRENGFICFDCDPRNGYSEASWQAPESVDIYEMGGLWQVTGGGGYHVLFDNPGLQKPPGKIGQGLDVRDRGYIVVAPSIHSSGEKYEWLPISKRSSVPEWLIERLKERESNDVFPLADGSVIPQGERNNTLFLIAASLRSKGFDQPEILAFLRAVQYRLDPPMDDWEIVKLTENVCTRYAPDNPIWGDQVAKNRDRVVKNRRVTLADLHE